MHVLEINSRDFPAPLANINAMRGQSKYESKKTSPWRVFGKVIGRNAKHTLSRVQLPVRVWVEFRFSNQQRRDTANYYPTVKALLDGLVDSGLISDDRDGYIEGPFLKRTYPNGPERLRVIFEHVPANELGKSLIPEE